MKKPYFYWILAITSTILLLSYNVFSQTVISSNTNWSAILPAPTSSTAIEIHSNAILTVDVSNAVCLSLIAGGGSNPSTSTLFFNSGSQLTVSGTVTIGNNGQRMGSIDMTNGGTLKCDGLAVGNPAGSWIPGTGTVELTATNTVPTNLFTTFNNLTISGGTTTLDADIALTGDWNYTSTSTSIGGTGNVSIAGNFTNTNASLDVTTTVFTFNGSGDQTISSASTPLPATTTFGDLVIDKTSGTIQLLSDVAVVNTFAEINGTLDLNGYTLWVGGNPLPVELSSFSAVILENRIKLNWRTETEVNNYGFEIQRSVQTNKWESLGFIEGHGNSNSPKEYNFTDSEVNNAGTYSYRLKQIDNDGTYDFSKTIEVNFGSPINFVLNQNYPNPFNPTTTISFTLPQSSNVALKVFNSIGEEVLTLTDGFFEAGVYTFNFNADGLPSGMYIYQLNTPEKTEVKKMILMK